MLDMGECVSCPTYVAQGRLNLAYPTRFVNTCLTPTEHAFNTS